MPFNELNVNFLSLPDVMEYILIVIKNEQIILVIGDN